MLPTSKNGTPRTVPSFVCDKCPILVRPAQNSYKPKSNLIITAQGIGPVKLGMTASELPESVPGLYDRFFKEASDINYVVFYLNNDEAFTTEGFDKIQVINVNLIWNVKSAIKTTDGISVGCPAKLLLTKG